MTPTHNLEPNMREFFVKQPKSLLAWGLGLALWALSGSVLAQSSVDDPDWKESDTPAPPVYSTDKLVPIDMPRHVSLAFGVDPATLMITPDGIVRYVMVAVNTSGSAYAMYEGIRCATGQVKSYARSNANGPWSQVKVPVWRDLNDNMPSKHALALARQGACDSRSTAASTVADIIKALKK